jgi:surface polysaccharide O-acyltransferase-like enzyme
MNENIDELQSKTIDWLRFPLVIGVVFIHMHPFVDMRGVNFLSFSSSDFYCIVGTWGSYVVTTIAVPCFFMFSGYLFFYKIAKWNKAIYLKKIKSRTKTLVVPYLLWNLILIFIYAALKLKKMDGSIWTFFNDLYDNGLWRILWNYNEWGSTNTNILGWIIPSYGPYHLHLWFLRDLIIMVFFSPLVYYFAKYAKHYGIALLGILYYTKIGFVVPGFSTGFFLTAFFFFSLGAYFSIHGKNMVMSLRKGQVFWLLLAMVTMVLSTYYDGSKMKDYFSPFYELSGVITAVNISSFLMERGYIRVRKTLSKASFFIYATHGTLVLAWAGKLFDAIFRTESSLLMIIRYFTLPLLCVLICLGLYCLMKKLTPRVLSILTGNR